MIQGIIEILTDDVPVQTAVGLNKAADKYKVYPVITPQTEKPPYVVCALTGASPAQTKDCVSSLDNENFDLLIYGNSYEQADNIDRLIRTAIDGKQSNTDNGVHFSKIYFQSRRDAAVQGPEGFIFCRVVSYSAEVKVNVVIT
jgi:hypothetical protein